jgi:uncharacterized protein (TIGR02646 family)
MMPAAQRGPLPAEMSKRMADWSNGWMERVRVTPSAPRFRWPQFAGRALNAHLIELLRPLTERHCAYCDGYPLGTTSQETVDHFEPKSRAPERAFDWHNLYLACNVCQACKLERFDSALLRPDEDGFAFERYFVLQFRDGTLAPQPAASPEDQHRARVSIAIFGLNAGGRPAARLRAIRRWRERPIAGRDIRDEAYRFGLV